jgi:hypothetical protein
MVQSEAGSFGQQHFGGAELGNRSRTRRLVEVADQVCRHPGGTMPQKLPAPEVLKACRRLMARPETSHAAVLQPHRDRVFAQMAQHPGTLLVLHDTTELDYTSITSLGEGIGPIGNGSRRGYLCHHSLVVDPQERRVVGLASQILHVREPAPANETREQSRRRESRESRLWLQGTAELPGYPTLVDVADQAADTTEFLESELASGRRFVIRAKENRRILRGHGPTAPGTRGREDRLCDYARRLPSQGQRTVRVRAQSARRGRPARKAREAVVQIAFAPVRILPPSQPRGEHSQRLLPVWVVRVWEPQPPAGEEPLEWILLTNEPVEEFADGVRVTQWYEKRWVVEEFHKAQKTGCDIERLQFRSADHLEPMIALLSVVASTLLDLRDLARQDDADQRRAQEVVPREHVLVLSAWREGLPRDDLTVREFVTALARLGGHQNRRSDGPPGWLVLWRGWTQLNAMVAGYELMHREKLGHK